MKIKIENFGPICSYSFDLDKDLHILFGKNNIGKSYAISAIYLILKNLLSINNRVYYRYYEEVRHTSRDISKPPKSFEDIVYDKLKENENDVETSIKTECEQILLSLLNRELLPLINQSFTNSYAFENLQNRNTKEPLLILLQFDFATVHIGLHEKIKEKLDVKEVRINKEIVVKKINSNRSFKVTSNSLIFYYNSKTKNVTELNRCPIVCLESTISSIGSLVQNVYFLPASRSGLYNALSAFGAIIAELSQNRNFLRSKIEIPSISEPISDYFLNLNSVRSSNSRGEFVELVKLMEEEILKGKVTFNSKSKKFIYIPNDTELELDLSYTSSMISEIAPIIAHLKYVLSNRYKAGSKAKNLIFIEEPEAHLHPEIQTQLIKYFSQLINNGLKIVMTSHSNYILNKLSNLIIGKEIDKERVDASLMITTKQGSTLKRDAMSIDDDGISDDNFADIAEKLYEERMQLYSAINNQLN